MIKSAFIILVLTAILITGCQKESKVSPTKGHLTVEVDPSVYPVIVKEKAAFDSLYKEVKVNLKEVDPMQGMVNVINGNSKVFISPRYFNKKEIDFINKEKINIQTFKFCYLACAVIAPLNSPTDKIRVDEIKDALMGNLKNYSFVIPQSNTATYQYIQEEILDGSSPKDAEIVPTDNDVLKKISEGGNKLGILSFNTVQDSSKIKFLQVGQIEKKITKPEKNGLDVNYFTPHPGFLIKKYYPLSQTVYIYLHELLLTPASGFTTFLTSYEGQKIALRENLAPAAVPVRINESQ